MIDLESSPKTISLPTEDTPVSYIGPEGGSWTLVHKFNVVIYGASGEFIMITMLSPSKGTFRQTALDVSEPDSSYTDGACTNITAKKSEKPADNKKPEAKE